MTTSAMYQTLRRQNIPNREVTCPIRDLCTSSEQRKYNSIGKVSGRSYLPFTQLFPDPLLRYPKNIGLRPEDLLITEVGRISTKTPRRDVYFVIFSLFSRKMLGLRIEGAFMTELRRISFPACKFKGLPETICHYFSFKGFFSQI
jgi:hypothetical protein